MVLVCIFWIVYVCCVILWCYFNVLVMFGLVILIRVWSGNWNRFRWIRCLLIKGWRYWVNVVNLLGCFLFGWEVFKGCLLLYCCLILIVFLMVVMVDLELVGRCFKWLFCLENCCWSLVCFIGSKGYNWVIYCVWWEWWL